MYITDFTKTTGVSFEQYRGEFIKSTDSLTVKFGNYARVSETVNLVEGDYAQASVTICLPESYPFGSRMWSERWINFDNYQQDPRFTVRVALMCQRSGALALVSNRGTEYHLMALSNVVPPLGKDFTLTVQVYFSAVHGLIVGYMDGEKVLYGAGANIDTNTIIGRCRIGVDGASGAGGQTATFRRMVSEYGKRI